ncbi:hypothetical protein V2O64_05365 [Verrucomicrobiaceae bacterium 227]
MNKFLKPVAMIGLLLTIAPPILLFLGVSDSLATTKNTMFAGMIIWFTAAIPWLAFQKPEFDDSSQDQI